MQTHPGTVGLGNFAQLLHQVQQAGLDRFAVPETGAVFNVNAIGRGVLADHQKLLDAAGKQRLRFAQHIADGARDQITAHRRNDAKGTAVVAAFADLEVGKVARRELDACDAKGIGHQVDKGVMRFGQMGMDGVHHLLRGVGSGHGQHAGVHLAYQVPAGTALARRHGLGTKAAGHDDLAVFGQRLAYGVQAFAHGVVNKAAGVDDHQISALQGLGGLVALGAELGQDQFGVRECLWAAQTDETHLGRGLGSIGCRGR